MHYRNKNNDVINEYELTSRLQQCLEIKEKYKESIVLFEYEDPLDPDDGDRAVIYEAYCFDAIEIAIPLDIVITDKLATYSDDKKEFMHVVRFPDYGLKAMLRRLLVRDRKVVVVQWRPGSGKSNRLKPFFQFPRLDVTMCLAET